MNYNVTIKTLPERYAATVRMTIPRYEDEGMVWSVLCRETDRMHLVPEPTPAYCSRDVPRRRIQGNGRGHARRGRPSRAATPTRSTSGSARCRPSPYAGCTFKRQLRADHRRVSPPSRRGSRRTATRSTGPMFNIYHVSPHETQNPDEFVTEVCYPGAGGITPFFRRCSPCSRPADRP